MLYKKKKRATQSCESLCGLVIRSHTALLEVSVTYSFKIHQNDDLKTLFFKFMHRQSEKESKIEEGRLWHTIAHTQDVSDWL